MPDPIQFFDQAAHVGETILAALGDGPSSPSVATYLERSGRIYRLMAQVHDHVAGLTVEVGLSRDLAEAHHALSRLDSERLEDAFRVRRWCDEFEWMGKELQPLSHEVGLAPADDAVWNEFCHSLSQREGEVAFLYEEKLYDLRQLKNSGRTLDSLKQKVNAISEQLITQKAKFDLLAMKAEAIRRRMN